MSAQHESITGNSVQMDGERYFQITNTHLMPEFFMSLVGSSDHWMFISSLGALTAGRCDLISHCFRTLQTIKFLRRERPRDPILRFEFTETEKPSRMQITRNPSIVRLHATQFPKTSTRPRHGQQTYSGRDPSRPGFDIPLSLDVQREIWFCSKQ